MDAEMRKAVEKRAYALWDEAGRPDGSSLLYWLRAEEEFGIIPKAEADEAVPTAEQLPGRVDENPISEHVERIAQGKVALLGSTTVEGGDKLLRGK